MNDATLERLGIRPGKLNPKFEADITSYYVVVPSDTRTFLIDPLTSDRDASWTVMGIGNKRQLQVSPGTKKAFVIEVTAEDGTTKEYKINVNCLSPNDASLSELQVSVGEMDPHFTNDICHYRVYVPWYVSAVDVTALSPDKDTSVTTTNALNGSVALNYGESSCEIQVTSPNKKMTKTFYLKFIKDRMNFCIHPLLAGDRTLALRYQCPACLNVTHSPRIIRDSQPEYLFCKLCLETITRRYPFHPILHTPLFENFMIEVENSEQQLATMEAYCPFNYYGCRINPPLAELGQHASKCNRRPTFVLDDKGREEIIKGDMMMCRVCSRKVYQGEKEVHLKYMCVAKYGNGKFMHRGELRPWERAMQQKYHDASESDDGPAPKPAFSPADAIQNLTTVAWKYATAISLEPKNAKLHFKLGMVFEEIHLAQDIYGVNDGKELDADDILGNDKDLGLIELGGDAANEEEVKAICQSRNLPPGASIAQQLKALDEEYHYLLDENLSAKADYVQKLYAWKSKQSTSSGFKDKHANDEDCYLHKAYLKYLDASFHDPNKHLYHLHVGRHLISQKKYQEAIKRLQVACGLRPANVQARFYLALAVSLGKDQSRSEECLPYFRDGIDYLLMKIHQNADMGHQVDNCMSLACNFISTTNTLALEGMLQYAKLINVQVCGDEEQYYKSKQKMSQMLHLVCVMGMHFLQSQYHSGETAKQIQLLILKAHYTIGTLLSSEVANKVGVSKRSQELKQFWVRLASLMKAFGLPTSKETLELERKICEEAVFLQPCSSRALCRLADNRLAIYDFDIKQKKYLREADAMYRLSISMEGRSPNAPSTALSLLEASWYKEKIIKLQDKALLSLQDDTGAEKKTTGGKESSQDKPNDGKATATTTKAAGAVPKANKTVSKPTSGARRGTVAKTGIPSKVPLTKKTSCTKKMEPKKASSNDKIKDVSASEKKSETEETDITKLVEQVQFKSTDDNSDEEEGQGSPAAALPILTDDTQLDSNAPSYQARLGLARVLVRYHDKNYETEINSLYKEVIHMAPYIHDAYIELGEILTKLEPMKAVDLYSTYPFSQNTSTDDAYLHGEIVRLLMKGGYHTDPRLGTSMVMCGKALGFPVLEKYVNVLEDKGQTLLLRRVYAAINGKAVDDPDLTEFFRFKCWI